jgi:hypothetical protein
VALTCRSINDRMSVIGIAQRTKRRKNSRRQTELALNLCIAIPRFWQMQKV